MGVSHGPSRVGELRFRVFGRVIHPDWFSVQKFIRLGCARWEADIRVIEGGHAVVFRMGSRIVTEALSGPSTELPEPGLLFHSNLQREQSASLVVEGKLDYCTAFEVEWVDAEIFSHLTDEMALAPPGRQLFHQFSPSSRLSPAPISCLRFESRSNGLSLHSFHSFPEELAIVRTHSLFESL